LKVLVTGGAGFIGSHLVDRLVSDGAELKVLDNLSTGNMENIQRHVNSGRVELIEGDIRDTSVVKKAVEGVSVVAHLAAQISVSYSIENPAETYDVNTSGTLKLLQAGAQAGIKRFVFASSCAVYGDPKFLPITELHPTNPISPYADSKLRAEQHCLDFHEKHFLESVVFRFFNVYGPRQGLNDYSGVITKFICNIKQNKSLTIFGDGTQTRDFVNVADIVEAIKTSIHSSKAAGEIIHVGTGKPTSINELAETLLQLANSKVPVNHWEERAGEIKQSYADISKAAKLLGYVPCISLSEGLGALLSSKDQ
jgi:nucleoside-diphosphate-sugar epimerase